MRFRSTRFARGRLIAMDITIEYSRGETSQNAQHRAAEVRRVRGVDLAGASRPTSPPKRMKSNNNKRCGSWCLIKRYSLQADFRPLIPTARPRKRPIALLLRPTPSDDQELLRRQRACRSGPGGRFLASREYLSRRVLQRADFTWKRCRTYADSKSGPERCRRCPS